MYFPFDPIIALIVVAVAIACFALKGDGEGNSSCSSGSMKGDEDFSDWFTKLSEKNRRRNEERLRELEEWKK